jgi:hypothetical protein
MPRPQHHLGWMARTTLALAGLGFVALPFLSDADPREWELVVFGGLFLVAAVIGHDPVASRTRRGRGSYWFLAEAPKQQPITFAVVLGVIGGLYSLYYDTWRHGVFAAAAGLLIGTLAPLLQHRLVAFLIFWSALTGFLIGIRVADGYGFPAAVFFAGMFAGIYAFLIWGSERDLFTRG